MKLTIGENIKKLRREKNITQEELAEELGVSCAAVSKWERNESYPDIAMIFPLAVYFSVTTDELMGFDLSKREMEIHAIKEKHLALFRAKKFDEGLALIKEAKKNYPENLYIQNQYMWDIVGSFADNDPDVLLAHKDVFLEICKKTIERATDEPLRLGARNMQAKILFAEGKTEEALDIYRTFFPDWYWTAGQKAEQLFPKSSAEFAKQLRLNQYELTDFAMNKKLKEIWHCRTCSAEEKTAESFALADALHHMAETAGEEFYLAEYHVLDDLIGKFHAFSVAEEMRLQNAEKRKSAAALCNAFAEKEPAAKEYLLRRYHKETL